MNNHAAQYEIVSIDSVKVKVNYKLEKTKVSHSEKWDTFVIYSCTNQQTVEEKYHIYQKNFGKT